MLVDLGIVLGHMLGDYIFQNDWMAKNKTNELAGPAKTRTWPGPWSVDADPGTAAYALKMTLRNDAFDRWYEQEERRVATLPKRKKAMRLGHYACTLHCLCYTLAVWAMTLEWMPWWGLLACFLVHWPVDRFRLAGWWMRNVSGQAEFAKGPLSPWSVIMVDNIFHLLTLYVIARIALTV